MSTQTAHHSKLPPQPRCTEIGDVPAIIEGLRRNGAECDEHIQHLLTDSHDYRSIVTMFKGQCIAHLGAEIIPIEFRGRNFRFGIFRSAFVDESFRVCGPEGVFQDLMATFSELFEEGEQIDQLVGCFHDLDWWHLQRTASFRALATRLTFRRAVGPMDFGEKYAVEEQVPKAIPARGSDEIVATESGHLLRSLEQRTKNGSRSWCAHNSQGDLVGMVLVDRDGDHGIISAFLAAEPVTEVVGSLLSSISSEFQDLVFSSWNPDPLLLRALQSFGFRIVPYGEPHLAGRSRSPSLTWRLMTSHWQVSTSMAGCRPLPPLSGGEQIVYPPYFVKTTEDAR